MNQEQAGFVDRLIANHRNPLTANSSPAEFREHREELNRKLRAAFLAGVAEARGRDLTGNEFREALAEYPGDLPTGR